MPYFMPSIAGAATMATLLAGARTGAPLRGHSAFNPDGLRDTKTHVVRAGRQYRTRPKGRSR